MLSFRSILAYILRGLAGTPVWRAKVGGVDGRWWLFVASLIALVTVSSLSLGSQIYGTNDNLALKAFADGSFTGDHESRLIYTSQTVGYLLKVLYLAEPSISWFDFGLAATNVATFVGLAGVMRHGSFGKFTWTSLCLTLYPWLLLDLNFTSAALSAASVGALILIKSRGKSGLSVVSGGFFLLLGVSWREDALVLALIVVLSFFGTWVVWQQRKHLWSRGNLSTLFLPILVVALSFPTVAIVNDASNNLCVENPEICEDWVEYEGYNSIRETFHGSERGELLRKQVPELSSWRISERQLFLGWAYFDVGRSGYNQLSVAHHALPNPPLPAIQLSEDGAGETFYQRFYLPTAKFLTTFGPLFAAFGLFWAIPLLLSGLSRWREIIAILILSGGPLVGVALVMTIRSPDYILLSFLATIPMSIGLFFSDAKPNFWLDRLSDHPLFARAAAFAVGVGSLLLDAKVVSILGPQNFFLPASLVFSAMLLFRVTLFASSKQRRPAPPFGRFLVLGLILASGLSYPASPLLQIDSRAATSERASTMFEFMREYRAGGGAPVFASGGYGSLFQLPPSLLGRSGIPEGVILGGWPTFSPHWDKRLGLHGLEGTITASSFLAGDINYLGTYKEAHSFGRLALQTNCGFTMHAEADVPLDSIRVWRFRNQTC